MSSRSSESPASPAAEMTKFECVACHISVSWPAETEGEPSCLRCRVQMRRVTGA